MLKLFIWENSNRRVSTKENKIFISVIIPQVWSPPEDWTATNLPAVYRSFDNNKYVQLENGAQVVAGKVDNCESHITNECINRIFHDKEICCISVRLSDRSKVTQNKMNFIKKCSQ